MAARTPSRRRSARSSRRKVQHWQTDGPGVTSIPHSVRPKGGTGSVAVSSTTTAVGGVGVRLSPVTRRVQVAGTGDVSVHASSVQPLRAPAVTVTVEPPSVTTAAGITGVIVALSQPPGSPSGTVTASIDYSSFANLY